MNNHKRVLVLYGSQTFTAQEIAERIWRNTKILGFSGPVLAMDDYPIIDLRNEEFVILVCATTGQGEVPDNMKKFWRFLLRRNLPPNCLVKLKFGVLALGDSSYSKFNFAGKMLHKRLLQLGAEPLLNIGLCDYQHDLGHDGVAIPWLKEYFNALKPYFPDIETSDLKTEFVPRWKVSLIKTNEELQENSLEKDIYYETGWKDPFLNAVHLEVEKNERTTSESHFQDVRLITFKTVEEDKLDYNPGDIFNIRARNSTEDIDDLFGIFETHGLDIKPHYKLLVEKHYDGPDRVAVIGGVSGGANTLNSQDDEYRFAGVEDPKIMITTSREPSARLKMFVKELRLIFPNSQRMNRGGYEMSQLIHACRANEVTDFIVVHEHRGVPDSLVICHLPYGPTASFTLSGVVMRHDIPDIGPMSEQYPHLIFHNFKSDLDMPVPDFLKTPLTLYDVAKQYWDLKAYPTQYFFSLLSLVAEDKLEREKCIELSSPSGQEDWLNYSRRPKRTPLEVLHDFHRTASKLTIEIIFELFSTIKPRSFSIASSALVSSSRLDILVAVVQYHTVIKKARLGLASNWLKGLAPGDRVYGWVKKGSFAFPQNDIPIIMVGPGTGLAPFRSLLQERRCSGTLGHAAHHLYFGCRYRERDYHCRRELEDMAADGSLTLHCAFSRDQDRKVYVQHKIKEHAETLWQLISEENAHIFVSGNAKSMPEQVRDAFVEVCRRGIGDPESFVEELQRSGRYQVETW